MEFSIDAGGHTNIESAEAKREEFVVKIADPQISVRAVCENGVSYNVYMEGAELGGVSIHGLLGEIFNLHRDNYNLYINFKHRIAILM